MERIRIAIIVPFANVFYSGGVTVQGRMWKEGLEELGNIVDLVDNWGKFDWEKCEITDIIRLKKCIELWFIR